MSESDTGTTKGCWAFRGLGEAQRWRRRCCSALSRIGLATSGA